MKETNLPSICKDHPNAEILHEWDREKIIWNGMPRGNGLDMNHHYYCNVCRTEVCSPEEYEYRINNK